MDKKIRVGIIGVGNMGTTHVKSITQGKCPNFVLTAVADTNEERKEALSEFLGDAVFFTDGTDLLDSGLVDACIIATPHYDHPTYAIECMKRGIHVMVEKPAGVYTKQVKEMNEMAKLHPEVVYAMMFNQRTNCLYKKMRELVQSGKYGQIRRTNWLITTWYRPQAYYNSGSWRATWAGEGGGVLLNQCPHQLDLWQWICGMPVKVQAHVHYGLWHDIEVDDDVTAYVEYENGATGVFITSTGDACGTNRFEIQMDGAKIVAEDEDKLYLYEYEMSEKEFTKTNTVPFGKMSVKEIEVELDGDNPKHNGVLNNWGEAILNGTKLIAEGKEGICGLTLSNAMHLSSWMGKEVTLPIDEDLYHEELMKRVATSKAKENVKAVVADTENTY